MPGHFEPTRDKALIGAAGVHFVASELSLRGLISLPTIRNTASIDIVAAKKSGIWHANLQVKTSRSCVKFWMVSKNWREWKGPNNFYVLVRYLEDSRRFEAFLESSAGLIKKMRKRYPSQVNVECYYLDGDEERLRDQWISFGGE